MTIITRETVSPTSNSDKSQNAKLVKLSRREFGEPKKIAAMFKIIEEQNISQAIMLDIDTENWIPRTATPDEIIQILQACELNQIKCNLSTSV